MDSKIHMPREELSDYVGTVIGGLASKSDTERLWDDEPNLDQMYHWMTYTLGGAFIPKRWEMKDTQKFISVVNAYPDAYDVVDSIFFKKYPMTKKNQEVCRVLKQFLKDQLTGVAEMMVKLKDDDWIGECNQLSEELRNKLHQDLGVYYEEDGMLRY